MKITEYLMLFEEFEIDCNAANDYIAKCLSQGGKLTQKLGYKKVANSVKYTYWSKEFPLSTINDFRNTVDDPITRNTTPWATKKVKDFLNSTLNRWVVSHELIFGSLGHWLNSPDCLPFFLSEFNYYDGKEVYYFISNKTASDKTIESILLDSGGAGPYCCALLIELPEKIEICPKLVVNDTFLEMLATNVKHIILTTFDMDGFIVCSFDGKL